jgi:hypothetical protein
MNSAIASVGKNLVLLGVLILSTFNFIFDWLNWKELLGIQVLAGFAYIFLSCYEHLNTTFKAALPVQRFRYFTNHFFMIRALKISVFAGFAMLLYFSGNKISYLYPICVIIATTEAVITYLKYNDALCFVNIYANYLLIVQEKFTKLFASEIMIIEFRHEIFYFVKKNRKTIEINLEFIHEKELFVQSINNWINRNNVLVSAESKIKIKELIA